MTSEVAAFRHLQTVQEQSAHNGLYGYAMVARHDLIEARLEQGADRIVALMQAGETEQAIALMNTPFWGTQKHLCQDSHNDENMT